jgi:hypothetical protein
MPTSHANCLGMQTIGLTQETWMPSGCHLAEQLAPDLGSEVIENADVSHFQALIYCLRQSACLLPFWHVICYEMSTGVTCRRNWNPLGWELKCTMCQPRSTELRAVLFVWSSLSLSTERIHPAPSDKQLQTRLRASMTRLLTSPTSIWPISSQRRRARRVTGQSASSRLCSPTPIMRSIALRSLSPRSTTLALNSCAEQPNSGLSRARRSYFNLTIWSTHDHSGACSPTTTVAPWLARRMMWNLVGRQFCRLFKTQFRVGSTLADTGHR